MPPPQGTWNPIEGPGDYTTTKKVHNDTYPNIDPSNADFSGKAVFISGASRGIGRSIALSFAKAGASFIAIGARSDLSDVTGQIKDIAVQAGRKEPRVLALVLDVINYESVVDAANRIEREVGKLDVVINNAGALGEHSLVADSDPMAWWRTMEVNVRGPYHITQACLPLLLRGELKTLITVSSVGAHCVSPTLSAYQTSKLAVLRFTEFVAAGYREQGVVAFSVHPGNILTDIVGRGEGMDEKLKAVFTETPELCADTLVFLSREQRLWLSGRYVNCTWDMPELTSPTKADQIVKEDLLKVKLAVP